MTMKKFDKLLKLLEPMRAELDSIDELKEQVSDLKRENRTLKDKLAGARLSKTKDEFTNRIKELEKDLADVEAHRDEVVQDMLGYMDEISSLKAEIKRLSK